MKTNCKISKETAGDLLVITVIIALFILLSQSRTISETAQRNAVKPHRKITRETEVSVEVASESEVKSGHYPITKQSPGKLNGSLPPINANYRKYIGFAGYAFEMRKRGARFFITSDSSRYIFEIDFANKRLLKAEIAKILKSGYCPRSKVIYDEPALASFLNKAKKELGIVAPEIHLLVPLNFESKIADSLIKSNIPLEKISSLTGYYKMI